jgi:hypothetical protein
MSEPSPSEAVRPAALSGWWLVGLLGVTVAGLLGAQWFSQRQARREIHPVISEIHAANRTGLRDETGRTADWIELWNPTDASINLEGWVLTDNFRRQTRPWRFPQIELPAGGFLVVFATGNNFTNPASALHTSFRLDEEGEYLALISPEGRVVQEFLPKYPAQVGDVSFGLHPDAFGGEAQPRSLTFLLTPTPGGPNQDEMIGLAGGVRFSEKGGLRDRPFPLELTSKTFGVEIRYTLDGSHPSATNGLRYTAPLTINRTTVVRAVALRPGYKAADPVTHTYIFPEQVAGQDGTGFPDTWGMRNGQPVTADYELDPEILDGPTSEQAFVAGLRALPTVSLTVPPESLFAADAGIYAHPLESGNEWERAGSFEWLPADHAGATRANCGVRIQGGWSRRPEESPKHSFRLVFRADYGEAELKHPLFGPGGAKRFRELILRAGCNNSWLHWSGVERRRGELLRDQWMRDILRELERPAARGTFVHLYLNGLYWGLYNLVERPGADFLAATFGGNPKDYDARNAANILSGDTVVWDELFTLANAGLASPESYRRLGELLDVPAFIDFMLVHLYGGSADMDRASNWYAGRKRKHSGRYHFLMWDGERSLEEIDANSLAMDDDQSPARLFQKLRENAAFRAAFAQRAAEVMGAGGELSPERAAARYRRLADAVRPAMICESARWGDYRRDVHPYREGPYELYTVADHWEPEVRRLLEEYFPQRAGRFQEQLRTAELAGE